MRPSISLEPDCNILCAHSCCRSMLTGAAVVYVSSSMIKNNENMETKDFTIFIHKRNWVKNEIRRLLELCAEETNELGVDK
jgi:hypothetical protein